MKRRVAVTRRTDGRKPPPISGVYPWTFVGIQQQVTLFSVVTKIQLSPGVNMSKGKKHNH